MNADKTSWNTWKEKGVVACLAQLGQKRLQSLPLISHRVVVHCHLLLTPGRGGGVGALQQRSIAREQRPVPVFLRSMQRGTDKQKRAMSDLLAVVLCWNK